MMDGLGLDAFGAIAADDVSALPGAATRANLSQIGQVLEIAGGGSLIRLEGRRLKEIAGHADPAVAMAGQVASQIKIRIGDLWLLANVRDLRLENPDGDMIVASIDFLGEGFEDRRNGGLRDFRRGVTRYPVPGAHVFPVTTADLQQIFAATDRPHVEIGTVYPSKDVRAALYVDALLGKHFALLGSTGTGKSTATALILHRICEMAPEGHVVMLDPHGEYAAAFGTIGEIVNVDNLAMPYWLMNFEEHCEVLLTSRGAERQQDADILAKCLLQTRMKSRMAQTFPRMTVDSPIPYLLSDLLAAIQTQMGKLDRAGDVSSYQRLKTKIEEMKADPRYSFMFSGMLVSDTMAAFMARIFRLPGNGKPVSIVDLSGVPSDIVQVVVAVLARMVFDFAIWSRQEARRPVLLVCEEAHRYVPSDRIDSGGSVRKILERIAKEGRKYGVSLGLVTQRPSDLAEGVLSQCGTIISMRLNNDRDQAFVRNAMPEGTKGFLDALPALRNRECIICGEGVGIPIRVRLDDLAPEKRPASDDPLFSSLWTEVGGEEAILERTIHRWRSQGK